MADNQKIIKARVQVKADTAENFSKADNFIPLKREPIFITDEGKEKIYLGDGTKKLSELTPFYDSENLNVNVTSTVGKALGDGIEIFNDYTNNDSNIPYSRVSGNNNTAKVYGIEIINFSTGSKTLTLSEVTGLAVGQRVGFFIINGENYDCHRGTIASISGQTIALTAETADITSVVVLRENNELSTEVSAGYWLIPFNGLTYGTELTFEYLNKFEYASFAGGSNTIGSMGTFTAGIGTKALALRSMAIGHITTASGENAFAEGHSTTASGESSHAENNTTVASGNSSHAEGYKTTASGRFAHAEGSQTEASERAAHAEGEGTIASGHAAHAEGIGTIASRQAQHVHGKFNLEDTMGEFLEIVGNGDGSLNRSNAYTLDWQGNGRYKGDVYTNETEKLATETYVAEEIAKIETPDLGLDTFRVYAGRRDGTTLGLRATAEGYSNIASGSVSHAEGIGTEALGEAAHVEGNLTVANTGIDRTNSAVHWPQHVQGRCNIIDSTGNFADIIGNGRTNTSRSNAQATDWNGNTYNKGNIYVGVTFPASGAKPTVTDANKLATVAELEAVQSSLTLLIIPFIDQVTAGKYVLYVESGKTKYIVVDNTQGFSFRNNLNITSVRIGDGVTSIGEYAFSDCDNLTSITIGDSVTSIAYRAFYTCDGLTSVTIPDSVTSIDEEAFRACNYLRNIYISASEGAISGAPWGATSATIHYNSTT